MATKKPKSPSPVIAENKKAGFNYFFEERYGSRHWSWKADEGPSCGQR